MAHATHLDSGELELISREPAGSAHSPALLFVPGGYHGASCWDTHFLPWFARHGWSAHALSLRGHGGSPGAASLQSAGLDDYTGDVLSAIERIGAPVVVIGHSLGGVVAERAFLSCSGVAGLVLFACSPLRPSLSVLLRLLARQPRATLRGILGRDPVAARPALAEFFFSDALDPDRRAEYLAALGSESQRAMDELFSRPPARREEGDHRPALVVAGRGDWSIPDAQHRRIAAVHDAPVVHVRGAHDLMLDVHWEEAAEAIHGWLSDCFGQ